MIKRSRYFILALVCCVLFWAVPVQVEAAYGSAVYQPSVDFSLSTTYDYAYLENIYISHYGQNESQIFPENCEALYRGSVSGILNIQLDPDYYYNGDLQFEIGFTLPENEFLTITSSSASVVSTCNSNDISVSLLSWGYQDSFSCTLFVNFKNYDCTHDLVTIPVIFEIEASAEIDNSYADQVEAYIPITSGLIDGFVNYLYQYSDIRDLPGFEGDIANQNQQIIVSIDQHDANVGFWFSGLTNNLSNWFSGVQTTLSNFFTPYFDNITNAFKRALSDTQATDNNVLSGAMDDYQAAEQEVFAPAMGSLSEFDFGSNDIDSLGTGFVAAITFLSSCMSNLYSLTPFSAVFDVIATLGLASICMGLSRLWFGKRG